ncbi:MAG: tyrosine-type recombinase/integrase [Actinomycetia bacterium]|nr:tyrosine-type recombinase/integrase [Actinomycetes bacterium]
MNHEAREQRDRVCEEWLIAQDSSLTTATYRRTIDRWFRYLDAQGVGAWDVRRVHVNGFRNSRVQQVKRSTVAKELSIVSAFYNYAMQEGEVMDYNPVLLVKRPKPDRRSTGDGLTVEEARAIRIAALEKDERTAALVHLLFGTAIRVSEAVGADVGDLGWLEGHRALRVRRKGGRDGQVKIREGDFAVIDGYLQRRKEGATGPLFISTGGRRMSRQTAYDIVRALAGATLTRAVKIGPHDIRHTAITLALDARIPIQEVRGMAGHSSVATTQRYDRRMNSRGDDAVDAVGDLLDREAGTGDR